MNTPDSGIEYIVCPVCQDSYAARDGDGSSCPSCARAHHDLSSTSRVVTELPPSAQPPSPPPPNKPKRRPADPLPVWLKNLIAIAATALVVAVAFASIDMTPKPVPDDYVAPSAEQTAAMENAFGALGILIFGVPLYFVPSLIARSARHRNLTAVVLTNVFFGWTLLGWAVALVWATMSTQHASTTNQPTSG